MGALRFVTPRGFIRLPEADRFQYLEKMIQIRFRDDLDEAPSFSQKMSLLELSRSASTLSSHDFRPRTSRRRGHRPDHAALDEAARVLKVWGTDG